MSDCQRECGNPEVSPEDYEFLCEQSHGTRGHSPPWNTAHDLQWPVIHTTLAHQ